MPIFGTTMRKKYIEISTNIPVIGQLIREIAVEISEMCEGRANFAQGTNSRVLC